MSNVQFPFATASDAVAHQSGRASAPAPHLPPPLDTGARQALTATPDFASLLRQRHHAAPEAAKATPLAAGPAPCAARPPAPAPVQTLRHIVAPEPAATAAPSPPGAAAAPAAPDAAPTRDDGPPGEPEAIGNAAVDADTAPGAARRAGARPMRLDARVRRDANDAAALPVDPAGAAPDTRAGLADEAAATGLAAAALQGPPVPVPAVDAALPASGDATGAPPEAPASLGPGASTEGTSIDATGQALARDPAEFPADPHADAATALPLAATDAQPRLPTAPTEPPAGAPIAGVASLAAAFAAAPTAAREAATRLGLALPTPLHAPDFAHSLGVHLSTLARDGVQHAELHLNPPEMGPVSVHIRTDGAQAQVHFGADVAATRAVLEAGMPMLAGALREAGFTLAGGGVSQHSRGRSEADGNGPRGDRASGRRSAGSTGTNAVDASTPRVRHWVSQGGVDLYA